MLKVQHKVWTEMYTTWKCSTCVPNMEKFINEKNWVGVSEGRGATLEIVFQEQSYSSLHSDEV